MNQKTKNHCVGLVLIKWYKVWTFLMNIPSPPPLGQQSISHQSAPFFPLISLILSPYIYVYALCTALLTHTNVCTLLHLYLYLFTFSTQKTARYALLTGCMSFFRFFSLTCYHSPKKLSHLLSHLSSSLFTCYPTPPPHWEKSRPDFRYWYRCVTKKVGQTTWASNYFDNAY